MIRDRIDSFLMDALGMGLKVSSLKMSETELWQMRDHVSGASFHFGRDRPSRRTYLNIPIRLVECNAWDARNLGRHWD